MSRYLLALLYTLFLYLAAGSACTDIGTDKDACKAAKCKFTNKHGCIDKPPPPCKKMKNKRKCSKNNCTWVYSAKKCVDFREHVCSDFHNANLCQKNACTFEAGLCREDTPVDGPGEETPEDGPGEETPEDGPGEETPEDGPGGESPEDGPGDESPEDGPSDEIPEDVPGTCREYTGKKRCNEKGGGRGCYFQYGKCRNPGERIPCFEHPARKQNCERSEHCRWNDEGRTLVSPSACYPKCSCANGIAAQGDHCTSITCNRDGYVWKYAPDSGRWWEYDIFKACEAPARSFIETAAECKAAANSLGLPAWLGGDIEVNEGTDLDTSYPYGCSYMPNTAKNLWLNPNGRKSVEDASIRMGLGMSTAISSSICKCTHPDYEKCESCNEGFHLEADRCVPNGPTTL